ncbi:hypothetical protein B0I35DRAFT_425804 [Stachybotrys elegans]|uniref:Zn(2)-C6 fungal-type domain-containing protein n=1 Tax=Stachybotrys elegans TaxID=80388 RepID=A0A8K0SV10_9HYPO|nr:hypothetical protein B0I35DRAFT_425804 [Stachybotrys elegans]
MPPASSTSSESPSGPTAMSAPSITTTPRRQSCDRCHGQKLRCVRLGSRTTGACDRCLRQGAQCVYSFSLPKGRPSMYRNSNDALPPARLQSPPAQRDITAPITPPVEHRLSNIHPKPANGARKTPFSSTQDVIHVADGRDESNGSTLADEGLPDTPNHASTMLWLQGEAFDWSGIHLDGDPRDASNSVGLSMLPNGSHMDMDMETTAYDATACLLGIDTRGNGENGPADSLPLSLPSLHEPWLNGPDASIAKLSQLSTRLYPLLRSSTDLAERLAASKQSSDCHQPQSVSYIDDAAFKLIASWLIRATDSTCEYSRLSAEHHMPPMGPVTPSDALLEAFSTSAHLVEILRSLRTETNMWSSSPVSLSLSRPSSLDSASSSYFQENAGHCTNMVIRHLVMACNTLILSTYALLLSIFQHDATIPKTLGTDCPKDSFVGAGLADIRLVIVVQLCSHLVERQCSMVQAYTNQEAQPAATLSTPNPTASEPITPPSAPAGREADATLVQEVRRRIQCLRQALRI